MIQAVLFDVDGTLLDSVDLHAESWRRTLAEFGHDIPFEKIRSQIGRGGDQLMPALLPKEEVDRRGKEIEERRGQLFKKEFLPKVRPFPQVRELFQRIREDGKRIALASSAKEDELRVYIDMLNIGDLIEAGTTSDDAEKSKPHPDIFQAALQRLGSPVPGSAMVVGDSPYDAEAATRAGCRSTGVLCGGFPEEDLLKAGAEAIFADPSDLLINYCESPLFQ